MPFLERSLDTNLFQIRVLFKSIPIALGVERILKKNKKKFIILLRACNSSWQNGWMFQKMVNSDQYFYRISLSIW